eukprot:235220-Pyramimonas_sp.AAC.1
MADADPEEPLLTEEEARENSSGKGFYQIFKHFALLGWVGHGGQNRRTLPRHVTAHCCELCPTQATRCTTLHTHPYAT